MSLSNWKSQNQLSLFDFLLRPSRKFLNAAPPFIYFQFSIFFWEQTLAGFGEVPQFTGGVFWQQNSGHLLITEVFTGTGCIFFVFFVCSQNKNLSACVHRTACATMANGSDAGQ